MKKLITLAVLALYAIFAVAAGGSKEAAKTSSDGPVNIKVWVSSGSEDDKYKEILDRIEAETGIVITDEYYPKDELDQKLQVSPLVGDTPELIIADYLMIPSYYTSGLIQPLDEYMPKDLYEDFIPSVKNETNYDGQIVSIAQFDAGMALWANKSMLENAGVRIPESWEDAWTKEENRKLLSSTYNNSLLLAEEYGCTSIAFPLISSGIYGYPKDEAFLVAKDVIETFLNEHEMDIYLVLFDRLSFLVSKDLMQDVKSYIDEHYVKEHYDHRRSVLNVEFKAMASMPMEASHSDLSALMDELDEPFNVTLLRLIDKKGKTDVEVYKKANIDRKLFSKIRTGKGYMPGKRTILALAIALQLSIEETDDLLKRAGYALSHSQKSDVIVEYFIINKNYDIYEINEVLFAYDQPLLGA